MSPEQITAILAGVTGVIVALGGAIAAVQGIKKSVRGVAEKVTEIKAATDGAAHEAVAAREAQSLLIDDLKKMNAKLEGRVAEVVAEKLEEARLAAQAATDVRDAGTKGKGK